MVTRVFVVLTVLFGAAESAAAQTNSVLAALVGELETRNPELAAARKEIDMRQARVAPAGALPDPTLSIGSMTGFTRPPLFPSRTTPDGAWQVTASQELPYPGKRGLRTDVATLDVDTQRWQYESLRRRLAAELKTSYLAYTLAHRTIGVLEEQRTVLTGLRDVAESTFRVGRGSQQDVFKVQLEVSRLLERQMEIEQERDLAAARVNALLSRPQTTPLPVELTFYSESALPAESVLMQEAVANDALLRRDTQAIARSEKAVDLARKERMPDFGVEVTSQKKVAGMPWMYGVDFMVKVPLFRKRKQDAMVVEANAGLDVSRQMREATRLGVEQRVAELQVTARTSDRLRTLYRDSIIPQARLALQASIAAYQVGSIDFLSVLSNFNEALDAEVGAQQQDTRYLDALVQLEPLVGRALVR